MILYHQWLELPLTTRNKLASDFGIIKRKSTHVQDNKVVHDGYEIKEIEQALNLKAIQDYVGMPTESNMRVLWIYMVDKAEGRELIGFPVDAFSALGKIVDNGSITVNVDPDNIKKSGFPSLEIKKRGRPAKKK